jgi:hypothetical protein
LAQRRIVEEVAARERLSHLNEVPLVPGRTEETQNSGRHIIGIGEGVPYAARNPRDRRFTRDDFLDVRTSRVTGPASESEPNPTGEDDESLLMAVMDMSGRAHRARSQDELHDRQRAAGVCAGQPYDVVTCRNGKALRLLIVD